MMRIHNGDSRTWHCRPGKLTAAERALPPGTVAQTPLGQVAALFQAANTPPQTTLQSQT